jgi:glycine cleavage system transcriptional repressor
MRTNIVFTLTGTDRTGIVEEVTRMLLDQGANVETSRMARLGGEFAVLMLVSLPGGRLNALDTGIEGLKSQGFSVTTSRTGRTYAEAHAGWVPYKIEVYGADHEGIIHEVARTLSRHGINIESMDTSSSRAPVSGAPLFSMIALVEVPPDLPGREWKGSLEEVGLRENIDITVSAVSRQ